MHILKLSLAFVTTVLFMASTCLAAPEIKVAYVDMQKALADSKAGGKARKEYEAEVKEAQKVLDVDKKAFQAKSEAFQKQKSSLSASALGKKKEELIQLEKNLKRNYQDLEQKLRRRNGQIIGGLVKELKKAVQTVGNESGYSMIVERGSDAVLYVDKQYDITEAVVKAFDAQSK